MPEHSSASFQPQRLSGRALAAQDSLDRQLETYTNGGHGLLQNGDIGTNDGGARLWHELRGLQYDPMLIQRPEDFETQMGSSSNLSHQPLSLSHAYPAIPPLPQTDTHTPSVSGSELYSSTDIDIDTDNCSESGLSGRGNGFNSLSPAELNGLSREDIERREKDKLEHRRNINRRSAQKHRKLKKEELARLQAIIDDRDRRIRALEIDLSREKVRVEELRDRLEKSEGAGGGDDGRRASGRRR
ncbi:hypothetical protein P7C73_g5352, partial [Tremellales sp. Uapishka_1]